MTRYTIGTNEQDASENILFDSTEEAQAYMDEIVSELEEQDDEDIPLYKIFKVEVTEIAKS